MDLQVRSPNEVPMNMVIRTEDGPLSLLVDEIGEVIELRGEQFEPPPANLAAKQHETLLGVYKLDGQLLLLLDPERLAAIQNHTGNKRTNETESEHRA